ncbi:hypothetical protein ETB91_02490 [Lacticaseibacillus rhamnosus]|nr:hypothetical protein [Lacticaseibacillus rhamnosus]RXS55261.1 hypothetical protein ETB91_02490 [Lacticaseibacillus rhamnosus]TLQ25213.1 hypothetical protein FEZ43_05890 [Lacticaseibacillus rhamnosus]
MALSVMAGLWPLRSRSLCAGFWAGERVSECHNPDLCPIFRQEITTNFSIPHKKSVNPRKD